MTNSASYARGLEPLLVWLAMRVNEDPAKKSVLEETAEVLFASSQPPLELEVRINALMTSYSAAASTDSSSESAPPHFTAAKTSHQLSIDHESFLVIWRAVVSNYRVLLHSKANAGRLCDITLDLLRSGCAATSQPLMFCTYDYDSDDGWLQGGMTTAWFAASTDMRLVLGMGATSPSWDILIDFDNGASGAQLKQNKSVAQSVVVDTQASGAPSPQGQAAAKFTVHMTHSCDPRVRRTIFKHNLSMWQLVREHGGGSTSSSGAEGTHDSLVAWRRNFDTDAKAIADMQTTEQQSVSDKTTNKLQHSAALQLLLRQYSLHSSHISWLLYLCARRGVDVASVSTLVTLKLRAGVLLSHMCKRSSRGRVVPINS